MKILAAHNAYQQRGGEDAVFENETALLERQGINVRRFVEHNDQIKGVGAKVFAALGVASNPTSKKKFQQILSAFCPDVVHIHNFFPVLSPSIIEAACEANIPTIITLHNYRSICASALLLREGRPCEDCLGHTKAFGIFHRCYRQSYVGSTCVSLMGSKLKALARQYPKHISFIALTQFAKSRFLMDGFSNEQITVRGNCIDDPTQGALKREKTLLYVGRLSPEKGVRTVLDAFPAADGQLRIVGDGPDLEDLRQRGGEGNKIFLGPLSPLRVIEEMKQTTALVMPSKWYEGFPMVALEAMATATPIIASRIGSLAEIVEDRKTGLLVDPEDHQAWQTAMCYVLNNQEIAKAMGQAAREKYLAHFSSDTGYKSLTEIYKKAVNNILSDA